MSNLTNNGTGDKVYIFHRSDMWYPIELRDDADAIANANCNQGTTLVTDADGNEVWPNKKEASETLPKGK